MESDTRYSFSKDKGFPPLERIDIKKIVDSCEEKWFNRTLSNVNDCVVRLGIVQGEFHWHKHDKEDEFFYVVSGCLLLDLENQSFELGPQQAFMVPRGVMHRTRATVPTVMLMIEGAGVKPTGD